MWIRQITITKIQDPLFILFAFFTCTYFIYYDFGLSAFISLGFCLFLVGTSFLYQLFKEKRGSFLRVDSIRLSFAWIAMVLFLNFLRLDSEQNHANIYYIGIILVCALMLLFSNPEQESAAKILSIFMTAALAVAAFTIFFSLFTDLYRTVIYPLLGENRKQYANLTFTNGYGVSLGGVTYTAYMIVMGVAIINGSIISHKKQSGGFYLLQLILCGVLLISLIFLGRKGELVSMVFAFALIWMIDSFLKTGKINKRDFFVTTFVLIALIIASLFLLPLFLDAGLLDRYISFFTNYRNGQDITSGRVQLWKWGWELFLQHPVFGAGLDSYSKYIPQSARITGAGTQVLSPHIVYLHILCEYGIVGFFLLIIPLGYILTRTLKQYIQLTRSLINCGHTEALDKTIGINAVSLFMQFFFAFLFFFDQTFSLVQFWLFYCMLVYLSSASFFVSSKVRFKKEYLMH